MGLCWLNVGIVLVSIFRRNNKFINFYGVRFLVILVTGCFFRIIFPLDISFAKIIPSVERYPALLNTLYEPIDALWKLNLLHLLILFTGVVGIFLLMRIIAKYRSFRKNIEASALTPSVEISDIYSKVLLELNVQNPPRLIQSFNILIPCQTGLFDPIIILPKLDLSESEIYYILKHELAHYINHDSLFRWFGIFLFSLFWWNPFIYLLKSDLTQILEIRCDLKVCENMGNAEKIKYTETILNMVKFLQKFDIKSQYYTSAIVKRSMSETHLMQRFNIILYNEVSKHSKYLVVYLSIMMFLILIFSYSFIVQPHYYPPENDLIDDLGVDVLSITAENSYILHRDEVYLLYLNNNFHKFVDETILESLILKGISINN